MDETLKKYKETATYIDGNGNPQTGIVLDRGEIGIHPVPHTTPKKSVSPTEGAGQTGAGQAGQTGAGQTGTQESLAGLYQRIYDETTAANEAARIAADQEAARLAEEQKARAAQEYADVNRGLYADYMHAVKNLPEQLAAYGINGGLAESSRVKLESGYGSNVGANERARLAGERDIASQLASQQYQNQANAAAANQTALQNYQQQQIQLAQQNAETLASIGDYSAYVELGLLTPEQAEQMRKAWIAQNPKLARKLGYTKAKRRSGGSTRNTMGQREMAAILEDARKNGVWTDVMGEMKRQIDEGSLRIVNDW